MRTMTIQRFSRLARHASAAVLWAALLGGITACGGGDAGAEGEAEGAEHAEEAGSEHKDEGVDAVVLDSAAMSAAEIKVGAAETVATSGLAVTGAITYDANRVSHIGPRTAGRIVALRADVGQRVGGGQTLAELESPEVGQLRADEREAAALLRIADENFARERRLEQQGISSRKEVLEFEAELRRAQAAVQSARERLRALGAGNGGGSRFTLGAPFPGVVVAREASLGEMASPEDQLYTIANLSNVWIELDIFERDLARVAIGQRVDVSTAAWPGRTFPGRIVYVGAVLDSSKRTVKARVEIPNGDGALKPGMFANARIQVGGEGPPMVVVPQDAVQEVEGRRVVFVPGDRPGEFRAQPVELGETLDEGRVAIRSGLAAGDRLVVGGAFALRSELAKGEFGEHGH